MPDYPLPAGLIERRPTLSAAGLAIPAALTLPEGRAPQSAVLLIPGSLFADVNGDYPAWQAFPGTNAWLAHQLAERGHAVFRYAKSGPGTGTVVREPEVWAREATWDGRVTIAEAAYRAMAEAVAEATGSDAVPAVVSGHSEGAVVALRLGQRVACAAVVSLAGPSTGILSIMRDLTIRSQPPEKHATLLPALDAVIAAIRAGSPIPPELATTEGVGGLAAMGPEGLRYMRESDATDPAGEAARLRVPLLVVQGTEDWNVPERHGRALAAANPTRSTLLLIEGLSHSFKRIPAGTEPVQAFGWPGPCDPRVAEGIADWLEPVVSDRAGARRGRIPGSDRPTA